MRFSIFSLFFLTGVAQAFTPSVPRHAFTPSSSLKMVDGPEDGKKIISNAKEIGFDAKTGRFFETGLTEDECIPEDEYCVLDDKSGELVRLTVAEKERIFLDALQAYYVTGRQLLSDEEFDLLKEDLSWNGSPLVNMNRNEAKYLAAMQAYLKGEPMISDAEFDALKAQLKEEGSKFAVSQEPKCYIDTGICTVTMKNDNFRNNLLYLPVGAIISIAWLGLGFALLEPIIRINPLVLFGLGSPLVIQATKQITDQFIFPDNLIVYGPCPSCEAENRVYFGNILGVEGFGDVATSKCPNCKVEFNVQRKTLRASTVPK
jgi:hypothetical protein